MANISFFHKFDHLAAILNILANFSQTQPEMHVYLNCYVPTHHKDAKKPYVINVHSRWHLAPSEAGLHGARMTRIYSRYCEQDDSQVRDLIGRDSDLDQLDP